MSDFETKKFLIKMDSSEDPEITTMAKAVPEPEVIRPYMVPEGYELPLPGILENSSACMCLNCVTQKNQATQRIFLDGLPWGCVVFAVEGDNGLIVQRMYKAPDGGFGPNWRVRFGKVEFVKRDSTGDLDPEKWSKYTLIGVDFAVEKEMKEEPVS